MMSTHSIPGIELTAEAFDDAEMRQAQGRLATQIHVTDDAVAPAVRAEKSRRFMKWLASSAVKLNFLLTAALLVSVAVNGVLGWLAAHPDRQYFASDNGRIFPLIPMSQPYRKPADVIQYTRDCMNRSFTMDFANWRTQLEQSRSCYTDEGFKSFLDALKKSGVLAALKERRMNMSITSGTGVMTKKGVEDGVYIWVLEYPIEIKLAGQTSEMPSQRFRAVVRTQRVPTLDAIEGIGIGQLVTAPM